MMRNLLRRNLVLGDAAVARRSRSVRPNRPTITKKMRPSPRNSPAAPLWLLLLSRPSLVMELLSHRRNHSALTDCSPKGSSPNPSCSASPRRESQLTPENAQRHKSSQVPPLEAHQCTKSTSRLEILSPTSTYLNRRTICTPLK